MLETRMEAAGIVVRAETNRVLSRLQLKLLAAAAIIACGVALFARHHCRPPARAVLSAVVVAFV
jgi:hypothetical protein